MNLGKCGDFFVEQGIIETYNQKKYYTEWIKLPNPEEDKKDDAKIDAPQYLKGKF